MLWIILALRYVVIMLLYIFFIDLLLHLKRRAGNKEIYPKHSLAVLASGCFSVNVGRKWDIENETVIGRDPGCSISIPDPYVSSRHARLFKVNGIYMAEDLGSSNGTFLNGKRLVGPTPVKPGDRLRIGHVVFEFNSSLRIRENRGRGISSLFLYPGLILAAGGVALYFNRFLTPHHFAVLLSVALFLSISSLLSFIKGRGDPLIFLLIGILSSLGLIFLYRINPAFGLRQSYWVLTGITAFWITRIFLRHYERLTEYKYLFMALGVLFLLLTILLGTEAGGARSWLSLGSFRFQPSELVKIFMVIFLAGYLDENREILTRGTRKLGPFLVPDWPYLGPLLAACGLSLLLLVFQRDLGMAFLFFAIFLTMVYAVTGRLSYLLSGVLLFAAGAWLMFLIFPHVQERIAVYLNPWEFSDSGGYQIIQSLFALGGGGVLGWGLGSGFPELIPAVHTDFIFPLLGEELGLAGTLGIVFIYAVLIWRGLQIALVNPEGFGRLLAFGCSSLLALQALIILGGVTNLIPLTGIPLPFLSYGGSSFVSNCFLFGILTKISEGE